MRRDTADTDIERPLEGVEGQQTQGLVQDSRREGATAPQATVAGRDGSRDGTTSESGLLGALRVRFIDFRSLSVPLRVVVALSIVAALAAAALIVLRDIPQAHLTLDMGHNSPSALIPTAAFIVAFALWLIAWALALTGAIHGHWALRLVVFAVFLYVMIETVVLDALSLVFVAPLLVIIAWMVAVSVLRWAARRSGRQLPRWLPALTFIVVLVSFAAHYAIVLVLDLLADPSATVFKLLVLDEFQAYSLALVPILFLTGTDFAEWCQVAAGQVNAWLRLFRTAWPLVAATVLMAALILAHELILRQSFAPFDLPSALDLIALGVFGLIALLLYLGVARLGRVGAWPRLSVPPGAFVAATLVIMALLTGPAYLSDFVISFTPPPTNAVDYAVFTHPATTSSPAFSLIYPSDWKHGVSESQSARDPLVALFGGSGMPSDPRLFLVGLPVANADGETLAQLVQDTASGICENPNCPATVIPAPDHGPWHVDHALVHDTHAGAPVERDGTIWSREQDATLWTLFGYAELQGTQAATPIFTAMVDSWRPDLSAQIPPAPVPAIVNQLENIDPKGVLSLGVLPLLLAVLIGLPLLLRGRRRPGPVAVAGLFFVVLGVSEGLIYLPQILARFGVPIDQIVLLTVDSRQFHLATMPTLSLPVLQTVTAFYTLVTVAWLAARRHLGSARHLVASLFLLNAGLQLIAWIDLFFATSNQIAEQFTVAQGLLLVLAFLWDLLTSGGQVTNAEGHQSPRFARLLLYVGYSILSFAQVLFFSTLAAAGSTFDFSDWTNIGLTALGVPLLLTVVLLRITRPAGAATAQLPGTASSALPVAVAAGVAVNTAPRH